MRIFFLFLFCSVAIQGWSQIIISGTSANDIIGRVARLPDTRLIAVIEQNPDWGSGDLYASFSDDNGNNWSSLSPVLIQSGNQSTFCVIVSPDDSIRVFYASDETGYYKIYTISSADGINWGNKKNVQLGWTAVQGVYDPVVIVEEDSSLTMMYLRLGGGAYVANCPQGGAWDTDKTLVQAGAYRARICKNNGNYLAAYHRNIGGNYDIHVKTSSDRINWSAETDLTSNGNSHDAYCNYTPDGDFIVYYAKVFLGTYNLHRRFSHDGSVWEAEEVITADLKEDTQPSFFIENDSLYLCWTHAVDYNTDNDIYFNKVWIPLTGMENIAEPDGISIMQSGEQLIIENHTGFDSVSIKVYSVSGVPVLSDNINSDERKYYDISSFRNGNYFTRIIFPDSREFSKAFLILR